MLPIVAVDLAEASACLPLERQQRFGLLGSGLLMRELGALAVTCRFLGGWRGLELWAQQAGLSVCEAGMRARCAALAPAGGVAVTIPACRSAGRPGGQRC